MFPTVATAPAPAAFPRAAKYDPQWVRENALGENALCQVESLADHLQFSREMRVLDLACGKATSSIFVALEFGAQVWAVDDSISPTDNRQRALDMGCAENVLPIRADARDLPFAKQYFDAAIAIDSFMYFGTDDRYLAYLMQFIKPGGHIGVVDIAFTRELTDIQDAPAFLRPQFAKHWSYVHTLDWWERHWKKTGLVDIECAEYLPESDAVLRDYVDGRPPEQAEDAIMRAVPRDDEGLISLFRLIARKR
jgi:cyclopropane fatty-acyl-phospholipid synthase-like methyltransferase